MSELRMRRGRSAEEKKKSLTLEEIQRRQEEQRKKEEEDLPSPPRDPAEVYATLQGCYTEYLDEIAELPKKYHSAAGLLGIGSGPKDDACHETFYDQVEVVAKALADAGPDKEMTRAAVEMILKAPETYADRDLAVMMLTAAQKHAIPLISRLTPTDAAELLDWYDRFCPRQTRLPIQKEVSTALKKAR